MNPRKVCKQLCGQNVSPLSALTEEVSDGDDAALLLLASEEKVLFWDDRLWVRGKNEQNKDI